ncbi:MAG: ABC transporter ATP-binding protein [Pseudomonadota bacterium]
MGQVDLTGITKSFAKTVAVKDLTMTIPDGAFVVLLGPTGAGKTTTLRLIAGLEKPDAGTVMIEGREATGLTPAQRNVAMVFQQYSLYPHMTVRENLSFPLRSPLLNTPQAVIDEKVAHVAQTLQISDKLDNRVTALSGGEMQRVSIGRALVRNPSIFLMDEPLSSLDAKLRADLRVELKQISSKRGATILYVTHDQIEAMTMATHIGVLREGELVQFGPPRSIYESPNSIYVASRLGLPRINILPPQALGLSQAGVAYMGLRPEHIVQSRDQAGGHPARLQRIENLGDQIRLHLDLEGHELVTLAQMGKTYKVGEVLSITARHPLLFDVQGARVYQSEE